MPTYLGWDRIRYYLTEIMIDLTSRQRKRYVINRCHYCNHDKYPNGKIIDPTIDKGIMTDKGDWKCGTCVNEDSKKLLKLLDGNK
jgi:hypothetical protein